LEEDEFEHRGKSPPELIGALQWQALFIDRHALQKPPDQQGDRANGQ
jgi:hypothetical protein